MALKFDVLVERNLMCLNSITYRCLNLDSYVFTFSCPIIVRHTEFIVLERSLGCAIVVISTSWLHPMYWSHKNRLKENNIFQVVKERSITLLPSEMQGDNHDGRLEDASYFRLVRKWRSFPKSRCSWFDYRIIMKFFFVS